MHNLSYGKQRISLPISNELSLTSLGGYDSPIKDSFWTNSSSHSLISHMTAAVTSSLASKNVGDSPKDCGKESDFRGVFDSVDVAIDELAANEERELLLLLRADPVLRKTSTRGLRITPSTGIAFFGVAVREPNLRWTGEMSTGDEL